MLVEENLRSKPLWSLEETGLKTRLEKVQNLWKTILHEALTVLDSKSEGFSKYFEDITNDEGKWDHFSLFLHGKKKQENCLRMPHLCSVIESIPEVTSNGFGQVTLRYVQLQLNQTAWALNKHYINEATLSGDNRP